MSRLCTRADEALSKSFLADTQHLRVKDDLPPIFRQMANSEGMVRAFMALEAQVAAGSLTDAEHEAVRLLVSERNGCAFCLSVHFMKAGKAGLDRAARNNARLGRATGEARIDAIVGLAAALLDNGGRVSDDELAAARSAGLDDTVMNDIIVVIAAMTLTNLFNGLNDTDLVMPEAPAAE